MLLVLADISRGSLRNLLVCTKAVGGCLVIMVGLLGNRKIEEKASNKLHILRMSHWNMYPQPTVTGVLIFQK